MWLVAIILGFVEGITEFLPISSTGHLILAGHFLNFTGDKAKVFEVVIQFGAILAVVFLYWDRFKILVLPDPYKKFSGLRGIYLLFLTSLPAALVGLIFHRSIQDYLFNPISVLWALGIGAIAIIAVEKIYLKKKFFSLDDLTPSVALGIGLFQCLALWPGFSRSGATIMGAMILGVDRKVSAEYSFIAAVPIMFAACAFDLLKNLKLFNASDFLTLTIGFFSSFVFAWLAVKFFISFLKKHTLIPFGIYRLAITALFGSFCFFDIIKF